MLTTDEPLTARDALIQLNLRKGRRHLLHFAKLSHRNYLVGMQHRILCDVLEQVERGQLKRVMVFMPPRHGKSELVSVRFPVWYLGKHPEHEVMVTSYAVDLALGFGRKARDLTTTRLFGDLFPGCQLRDDVKSAAHWMTDQGGGYAALGVDGGTTGKGAHILIIDDPVKNRQEADSEVVREHTYDWYTSSAYTRLAPEGAVIVCMTRWHHDDLAGRLLREAKEDPKKDQWTVVNLPAIAEDDEGWRKAGEALWPERYPLHALESIKVNVGTRDWIALYQQKPGLDEGSIIQIAWLKPVQIFPTFWVMRILSIDTAYKKGQDNDYTVIQHWGIAEQPHHGCYLIDSFRKRMHFTELKKAVIEWYNKTLVEAVLVEDKASGISLVQELQENTAIPVIPVPNGGKDKVQRAYAVTPTMEAGRVYYYAGQPWNAEYLEELAQFDKGLHDDQVDATTQALDYLKHFLVTPGVDALV